MFRHIKNFPFMVIILVAVTAIFLTISSTYIYQSFDIRFSSLLSQIVAIICINKALFTALYSFPPHSLQTDM